MGMAADNLECYENLANAIILQAVKDYKTVLFRLEDHPNNRDAQFEKKKQNGLYPKTRTGRPRNLKSHIHLSVLRAGVEVEAVERRRRRAENLRRKAEREMKKLVKLLTEAGAALTPENIRALGDIA